MRKLETLPPPPGVFGSLKAGFDVVSNKVVLILLPLGLDLFLWLGPRVSVNELLLPYFKLVFEQARRGVADADLERFIQTQSLLTEWLRDFNLLGLLSKLRVFPIGISSLSAQTLPVENPLGFQNVVVVSSFWIMFGLTIALVALGWIGGGVYFRQVAGSIMSEDEASISFLRAVMQSFLLSMIWLIGLSIFLIPLMLMLGVFALISPLIANIAVIVLLFFSFWLVVPVFFTPHGIFVFRQNAFYSIYSSLRMIRFSLPTSAMFVMSVFLLSRGLDVLWSVPESGSWLTLVGFAGHAFITAVLLTASFIYYRDMSGWLKTVYERFQQLNKSPSSTV